MVSKRRCNANEEGIQKWEYKSEEKSIKEITYNDVVRKT